MKNQLQELKSVFRTKPYDELRQRAELARVLNKWDLTSLGIGAIIGAGIFVLTGVAAKEKAGPAVIGSYAIAGISCLFSALSYSEFAARIPLAGSAYQFAYASFGEFPAFFIGWDLTLEYLIGSAAVARGWSGYFLQMFRGFGAPLPGEFGNIDLGHGVNLDILAGVIVVILTAMLARGIKGSSRFNHVFVGITIFIVLFVIFVGAAWTDNANLHPFNPFGIRGVFEASATVFFAFIGFDAVSTTAEEVVNPKKDLPFGIVMSLLLATMLYVSVAAVLVAMVPYSQLDLEAPMAAAFGSHGLNWGRSIVAIGAFAALTTSVLSGLISQPRIYYSMSRDGLLPAWFSGVRYGVPFNATLVTGAGATLITLFVHIELLAEMVSIGTLMAFTIVNAGVIHMRYTVPNGSDRYKPVFLVLILMFLWAIFAGCWVANANTGVTWIFAVLALIPAAALGRMRQVTIPETFACPAVPFVPILGIFCNIFMMAHLNSLTWVRMLVWLAIGLIVYFGYSFKHSVLAQPIEYGGRRSSEPVELELTEQLPPVSPIRQASIPSFSDQQGDQETLIQQRGASSEQHSSDEHDDEAEKSKHGAEKPPEEDKEITSADFYIE